MRREGLGLYVLVKQVIFFFDTTYLLFVCPAWFSTPKYYLMNLFRRKEVCITVPHHQQKVELYRR